MKNPYVIGFFLVFLIAIILVIDFSPRQYHYPEPEQPICIDGETKSCIVGSCNGTMACRNGKWSVCKWEILCEPGSRVPCSSEGCFNGIKICNECGTGYGNCTPILP
ncbi:hypothetical protein JXA56_02255 [Candidatus Micrarchaeota archaeon]|nr:hypothetical protein [Candidatus Micrarchaeota archaeon]